MITKLIEFNNKDWKLRGLLSLPVGKIEKVVLCLHGFERCATAEKKFKALSDVLVETGIATFRFDFSGCGISDGDFRFTTIERQAEELITVINVLEKEIGIKSFSVVAHSLGACVLASGFKTFKERIEKIVLIAPALNQKELMRYWFVIGQMKKIDSDLVVTWRNYREYLNEAKFIEDCQRTDKMTKLSYLRADYFVIGKDLDLSEIFSVGNDILHIHGDYDTIVPLESLSTEFKKQLIVAGGDHDLEKPDKLGYWLNEARNFLTK